MLCHSFEVTDSLPNIPSHFIMRFLVQMVKSGFLVLRIDIVIENEDIFLHQ